jgi:Bacterial Ig domain
LRKITFELTSPPDEGTQEPQEGTQEPSEGPEEGTPEPTEEPVGLVVAEDDFYSVLQGQELKIKGGGFLENDNYQPSDAGLFVSSWTLIEPFSGSLGKIDKKADGSFEYTPADGFIGTESFEYTACLVLLPVVCDSAVVVIEVVPDTFKPDASPIALDDFYTILGGETLFISDGGILSNDLVGNPSNPLRVCETDESNINQDLDTYSAGSFLYRSDKCWTGTETFTYRACYEDYPDMVSNWATVTIQVNQAPNRPSPPTTADVSYSVYEAETLDIGSGGLLSSSGSGSLYIDDWSRNSGFVGSLDVDDDGSFKYTAVSGGLGTQEFTFTVCHSGWDCVECRTATARIQVTSNPNKPVAPPQPTTNTIQVVQGDLYRAHVKNSLAYDERYTLAFKDFETTSDFKGLLNTNEDGYFAYGNAPVGNDTFSYRACYEEWPDLCSTNQITMQTKSGEPVYIGSARRGVATYYEISWAGKDDSGGCATTEPRLTLSCGGEGEISLIDSGLPNDNYLCKTEPITGSIVCAAQQAGVVYAECLDGTGINPVNRMIVSQLYSNAVACGSTTMPPPYHTYHRAGLKTWCGAEWVDRASTCSAVAMQDDSLGKLCYAEHSTPTSIAQPAFLTMMSADFNDCVVTGSMLVPAPVLPVLQDVSKYHKN